MYIRSYFYHLRAHKRHFTSSLLHVCALLIFFWIHAARSAPSNHAALRCILSLRPVFGSFRSIWFVLRSYLIRTAPGSLLWCAPGSGWQHSHLLNRTEPHIQSNRTRVRFIRTAPELVWKRTETHLFSSLSSILWCAPGSRWQRSHLLNRTATH